MNITQAKEILKRHNEWRRGGGSMPYEAVGQAIDVLVAAPEKQYGDIATELREAAINWPSFMSNSAGDIVACFCFPDDYQHYAEYWMQNYVVVHRGLVNPNSQKHHFDARIFLLFVAEAITC